MHTKINKRGIACPHNKTHIYQERAALPNI